MTNDSDWIKEVSKTYLEANGNPGLPTAAALAGKKPSYVGKYKRQESSTCKDCGGPIDPNDTEGSGHCKQCEDDLKAQHEADMKASIQKEATDCANEDITEARAAKAGRALDKYSKALQASTGGMPDGLSQKEQDELTFKRLGAAAKARDAIDKLKVHRARRGMPFDGAAVYNAAIHRNEKPVVAEEYSDILDCLTEDQHDVFAISFIDDLIETYSFEEIELLTEEQLEEGILNKIKAYAGGAKAAIGAAKGIGDFVEKTKKYGKDRERRLDKKDAVAENEKELATSRAGRRADGTRKATTAELHALVNKLEKSKGSTNKAILAKAKETLEKKAASSAGKGIGGAVAKVRGLLGNKEAMQKRIASKAKESAAKSSKVKVDAKSTVVKARGGYKKTTIQKIQALRAAGKGNSAEIKKLQATLPKKKKK